MTESTYTQALLAYLKAGLPSGVVVLKHSDRFTKGVPDLSCSYLRRTIWVEVKVPAKKFELFNVHDWVDNTPQLITCAKLDGFYLVHDRFRGDTLFITARSVMQRIKKDGRILLPEDFAYHHQFFCQGNGYQEAKETIWQLLS